MDPQPRRAVGGRPPVCGLLLLPPVLAPRPGWAQRSGGPYGPIPQTYAVPKAVHVYYVAPDGKPQAAGNGTRRGHDPGDGDREGRLRGRDRDARRDLPHGRPAAEPGNHAPAVPGRASRPQGDPRGDRVAAPCATTCGGPPGRRCSRPGPWVGGSATARARARRSTASTTTWSSSTARLLQSAGWEGELDEASFYVDYESGHVYIGADPSEPDGRDHRLRQRLRPRQPARARQGVGPEGPDDPRDHVHAVRLPGDRHRGEEAGHPRVRGADRRPRGPAEPGTYGREVVGTTLENVTISFCSRVAGYFRGDGLVLRNSLISDTSTEGFYVIGSSDVLLERNIFRRNNVEQLTGYYPAAVKIFNQSHRVTVRDNLVIDNPHSNGVWWDVGNRDGVFVNNWVENALVGFFYEISKGRRSPATCSWTAAGACGPSTAGTCASTTTPSSTARPPSSATSAARSATTSAGTRRRGRTSPSARATRSSATCWRRASPSSGRCCGSSRRGACAGS